MAIVGKVDAIRGNCPIMRPVCFFSSAFFYPRKTIMSDRERWIVFPLLLLAIGLALRNNLEVQDEGQTAEADVIRCRALEVLGPEGKPTVTITSSSKGDGLLEVCDAGGQ